MIKNYLKHFSVVPFRDYSDSYKYKRYKQLYLKLFEKIKTLISSEIKHRISQVLEYGLLVIIFSIDQ